MHAIRITILTAGFFLALLSACHFPSLPTTFSPETTSTISHLFETTEEESLISTSPPTTLEETSAITPVTSTEEISTMPPISTTEEFSTTPPIASTEEISTTPPIFTTEKISTTSPIPSTEESSAEPVTEDNLQDITEPFTVPITEPSPVLDRGRAEEAFQLQNHLLAGHGIDSLVWSEALYEIAAQRVQQITSDYSHNGCPDWVAENILMGTNHANLAIQIWYDSPGHQRNMLAGWIYGAVANDGFYWVAIYAMVETP